MSAALNKYLTYLLIIAVFFVT